MSKIASRLFTSNGTWTCPLGVTRIDVWMSGGGGGGGGGMGSHTTTSFRSYGGGGGGGAQLVQLPLVVVPNTTYNLTIGPGGVAGVAGTGGMGNGGNGNAGGTTFFDSLAFAYGGGYGMGGTSANTIPGGSAGGGPLVDTFSQYVYSEAGSASLNSPYSFRMTPQYTGPGYGGHGQNNLSVLSAGVTVRN